MQGTHVLYSALETEVDILFIHDVSQFSTTHKTNGIFLCPVIVLILPGKRHQVIEGQTTFFK
jgi:hypothetical protein